MKQGRVELYINEALESRGALLFGLIDPDDYKTDEEAIRTAKAGVDGGIDVVLIGGSMGVQGETLDRITKGIKDLVDTPVVLFPGNIGTLTSYADALYFMSLLNARNPYWITHAQMLAAPLIRKLHLEPLPVGYIVVHPGGTVGWVGDANLVPREKPKIAAALAMAGEYLGHRFILTDTGSNPRMQHAGPIPPEFVRMVKQSISVPYIVGGGILTLNDLRNAYKYGADIVQIGTAFESISDAKKKAKSFSRIVKEEGAKKLKNI
ncbi:MAG: geranylgeranylglyceryl/heptaprenylglyceryl phosphate synthase [Candidatus Micrarchaeaceae archaeon]|jgi:phosphoglycerol geranylgeranyltransferase